MVDQMIYTIITYIPAAHICMHACTLLFSVLLIGICCMHADIVHV
jgi:hypothetical protein